MDGYSVNKLTNRNGTGAQRLRMSRALLPGFFKARPIWWDMNRSTIFILAMALVVADSEDVFVIALSRAVSRVLPFKLSSLDFIL